MMHIALLSDFEARGGAAIAAGWLAAGLRQAGHRVTRIVAFPGMEAGDGTTRRLARPRGMRLLRRVAPESSVRSYAGWVQRRALSALLDELRPDIVNVHNLHAAPQLGWTPELVKVCAGRAPVAWTLHDMWSFTGRCAYSGPCWKYLAGCDADCPTFHEYPPLEPARIARAWQARRALLQGDRRLVAVTPSRWLADLAGQGLWAGREIQVIPNGLPLAHYRPWGRAAARAALDLTSPGPYLLIAAEKLADRRKGGHLLIEALRHVTARPLTLLLLGKEKLPIDMSDVHVVLLGYVSDVPRMSLVYSAADLLAHPATEDNLPNVVMEALACGTPVAAYPIGGVPEMVRPGLTGALAADMSPTALGQAIQSLLEPAAAAQARLACRRIAETEYSAGLQAARYLALFATMLGAP